MRMRRTNPWTFHSDRSIVLRLLPETSLFENGKNLQCLWTGSRILAYFLCVRSLVQESQTKLISITLISFFFFFRQRAFFSLTETTSVCFYFNILTWRKSTYLGLTWTFDKSQTASQLSIAKLAGGNISHAIASKKMASWWRALWHFAQKWTVLRLKEQKSRKFGNHDRPDKNQSNLPDTENKPRREGEFEEPLPRSARTNKAHRRSTIRKTSICIHETRAASSWQHQCKSVPPMTCKVKSKNFQSHEGNVDEWDSVALTKLEIPKLGRRDNFKTFWSFWESTSVL